MGKYLLQIILLVMLAGTIPCFAQPEANIANTAVRMQGDKVQITYDLVGADNALSFIVSLEITDSKGKKLDVKALEGDVGEVLKAGRKKLIIWDPAADKVFLNASIDIQVFAEMILPPPEPEPEEVAEEVAEPKVEEQVVVPEDRKVEEQAAETADRKVEETGPGEFNRAGVVLKSVLIPGLGLTQITGKPHWIKGVAGYGCIAGAIVFNKTAASFYEEYQNSESIEEANSLFSSVKQHNNISKGLGFAAVAIWVTDLTWTFVGTSDRKSGRRALSQKSITLDTNYDHFSGTPLLSFTYTF